MADRQATRRPDIQGLRALAVLSVVGYHSGLPIPGGFLGVDVFFVISGFVIAKMIEREFASSGRFDFKEFYLRRFKRLTPALATVVTATLLVATLVSSPLGAQATIAKTAVGAILLNANFAIQRLTGGYFDSAAEQNPLLHTWSLSVEEQFYLCFPLLLVLTWRKTRGRTTGAVTLALLSLAAIVSFVCACAGSAGLTFRSSSYLLGFYSPVSRAWEFVAGAVAALVLTGVRLPSQHGGALKSNALGTIGVLATLSSFFALSKETPLPGPWTILPVAGTVALLASGTFSESGWLTRLLSSRVLTKIGDYSYSIYLWHWPLIVFSALAWPTSAVARPVAALLSIVPAALSYSLLEQPVRMRPTRSVVRLVALTTLPPIVASACLLVAEAHGFNNSEIQRARAAIKHPRIADEAQCMKRTPFSVEDRARCTWNATASQAPVYLVGDSNAWQFADGAVEAARRSGHPMTVVTAPSCPLLAGLQISGLSQSPFFPRPWTPAEFAHCATFVDDTLHWLDSAPPGIVMIAMLDQYWWDETLAISLDGTPPRHEHEAKAHILELGLEATAKRLRLAGHRIIFVQTIPTFRNPAPLWDPRNCTTLQVAAGNCGREVPEATIELLQDPSRKAVDAVAARTPGATIIDLHTRLCRDRVCSTKRDGEWLYMDATHLSFLGSMKIAPSFEEAMNTPP